MFTKDLVVFDTETTGLNIDKHELIQIAAIRLEHQTLTEIDRFVTYIKPQKWETQDPEAALIHKIYYETIKDAPSLEQVLIDFEAKFPPQEVLLSAYNLPFDFSFLYEAYRRLGKPMPFDFHGVDIWAFAYYFWCNVPHEINPKKRLGFGLSDMAKLLGITTEGNYHDAVTDCEVEAEVLRRLISKIHIIH